MVALSDNSKITIWRNLFSVLFLLLLLLSYLCPIERIFAASCGHEKYYGKVDKTCVGKNVGFSEIWDKHTYSYCCQHNAKGGCTGYCCGDDSHREFICESWQTTIDGSDYGECECNHDCLDSLKEPKYYDNPINDTNRTSQQAQADLTNPANAKNISLPVVLAWKDSIAWNDKVPHKIENFGAPTVDSGTKSYRIQIWDDSKGGVSNLNLSPDNQTETNSDTGKQTFYKVLPNSGPDGFNSRKDGGECFFNSNSTYYWRVTPCCDIDGTSCKEYEKSWWTFTTGTGPEPIGVSDNKNTNPIADPDWNGTLAVGDNSTPLMDFCTVKLQWCKTKLPAAIPGKIDPKTYNEKLDFSKNYQILVKSSENITLLDMISGSSAAPIITPATPVGITGTSIINLFNGGAQSPLYSTWLTNKLAQADNYFLKSIYQSNYLKNSVSNIKVNAKEDCHYLQSITDPAKKVIGCHPDAVAFSYADASSPRFKPFFAAINNSSSRSDFNTLFSGGSVDGSLAYSWQTKICYGDKGSGIGAGLDYCYEGSDNKARNFLYNTAESKAFNSKYGQKWSFKTISAQNIESPKLKLPDNKPDPTNNFISFGDVLDWSIPCGANSYVYDVQKVKDNKSIFPADEYNTDNGRRLMNAHQISITAPTEDDNNAKRAPDLKNMEAGKISLELDTAYKWRVKSCWPSNPLGETQGATGKSICSDKWSYNDWWYFHTTGQTPKFDSLKEVQNPPDLLLKWDPVAGAQSYNYEMYDGAGKKVLGEKTNGGEAQSKPFNYPDNLQNYRWRVQTCADLDGKICGKWTHEVYGKDKTFVSKDFEKPKILLFSTKPLSLNWESQAAFSIVDLTYEPNNAGVECGGVQNFIVKSVGDKTCTVNNNCIPAKLEQFSCPGKYTFKIKPCFDQACSKVSLNKIAEQSFDYAQGNQAKSGLLVCGLTADDPATSWNEREDCNITHLSILVRKIIDWILFYFSILMLPIAVLFSGGMFYFSDDKSKVITTLKESWRWVGIGYGLLIFAWILTSILMMILGYQTIWWNIEI